MSMTLTLSEAAHRYGIDDFASTAPGGTPSHLGAPVAVEHSWFGALAAGQSGYVTAHYGSGLDTETDLYASSDYLDTITEVALYSGVTPLWDMRGSVTVGAGQADAGAMAESVLLSGDDTIRGNSWDNHLEGFGGNDVIYGAGGTDTAVFSGSIQWTSWTLGNGVINTAGPDGYDTLVGISRLEFDDYGIAYDVHGAAGEAYRLYQAAFARAPDLGGLGYHMHALDDGLSLSRVASNFVASPEFQYRYGALDNTHFVTQLYANVLHRAPDAGGLAYHVANLNAGASRGEVLVGFSESPENQANLIGQIDHGMLYVPYL